ncbi:MAG: hypothetical protein K9L68_03845 [Spirochaetales bacterium]|nr:hypothetical protein [Spirochaetales bacterium]MCF7937712.1 hypothetical protein [Spirochaetales bacterium]
MNEWDSGKEDKDFFQQNRQIILDGILGTGNPIQVGSSMAFAKYLSHVGLTSKNHSLFLKTIETNNKWVVDELVADRDPRLMFAVIRPYYELIHRAFELLSSWHPGQIYSKVLLTVLGTIEYSFYKPDDGFEIYPLGITDLHNLGKFLDQEEGQHNSINETILEILDRLTRLGEYQSTIQKNILAKHAYNIRDSFFDNTKRLEDIIPKVLLVRIKREDREVPPSREFIDFAQKIDNNDE